MLAVTDDPRAAAALGAAGVAVEPDLPDAGLTPRCATAPVQRPRPTPGSGWARCPRTCPRCARASSMSPCTPPREWPAAMVSDRQRPGHHAARRARRSRVRPEVRAALARRPPGARRRFGPDLGAQRPPPCAACNVDTDVDLWRRTGSVSARARRPCSPRCPRPVRATRADPRSLARPGPTHARGAGPSPTRPRPPTTRREPRTCSALARGLLSPGPSWPERASPQPCAPAPSWPEPSSPAALRAGAFLAGAFLAGAFFAGALAAGAAKRGSFLAPLTTAFRSAPALTLGTVVFLTLTIAPVRGLRAVRGATGETALTKPKPVMKDTVLRPRKD